MKVYEYISIYNAVVILLAISVVMVVFSMWQLRKRSRSAREKHK